MTFQGGRSAGATRIIQPVPVVESGSAPVARLQPAAVLLMVGRALTVAGLAAALFFGYEFLLTGFIHDRAQPALVNAFKQGVPTTTLGSPDLPVAEGDPVALVQIPRIGFDQVVVEGTRAEDLKAGSGHLRGSPLPGEFGNSVIAGRRTTYGAPFRELDSLQPKDPITVTTGQGSFVYTVSEVHPVHVGEPDPLTATPDSRLTLLTSDPAFLSSGRLAVVASLRGAPVAIARRPPVFVSADDLGLAGDPLGLVLALLWGACLAGAVWLTGRARSRWPRSVTYMLATPVIVGLAVLVFSSLDRVLPATL